MKRVLVFGGKGWLAEQFAIFYGDQAVLTDVDILNIDGIRKVLKAVRPEFVINAAGKTGRPNIDWCEESEENRRLTRYANDYGVAVLREVVCPYAKLIHLSSGCLWEWGFDKFENDEPDPPSWYSETKASGENRLKGTDALILRLRMPFDGSGHQRCLLTKLSKYSRIISYPNSITYIPDLLEATDHLANRDERGVFNVVNTGFVTGEFIINQYRKWVNPKHEFTIVTAEELMVSGAAKVKRSNCTLDNSKLRRVGFQMPTAEHRVVEALKKMGEKSET